MSLRSDMYCIVSSIGQATLIIPVACFLPQVTGLLFRCCTGMLWPLEVNPLLSSTVLLKQLSANFNSTTLSSIRAFALSARSRKNEANLWYSVEGEVRAEGHLDYMQFKSSYS